MAAVFFGLACVLTFGTPTANLTNALGDPGPALLPRIVGLCTGLLAVLLILQKEPRQKRTDSAVENPIVILLSILAIPAFYLLFEYLGYSVSVGLYLMAAFCLLGPGKGTDYFRYALVATAISLTSGMVFTRLLDLPLPGVMP